MKMKATLFFTIIVLHKNHLIVSVCNYYVKPKPNCVEPCSYSLRTLNVSEEKGRRVQQRNHVGRAVFFIICSTADGST